MTNNVLFDGVALGAAVPMFRLIDFVVGGVGRDIKTIPQPMVDGEYFSGARNATREITMIFCLPDESEWLAPRVQALQKINALLSAKSPRELRASALGDGYYKAVCTELPSVSMLGWTEELTATFTAYDPYFYSDFNDLDVMLSAGGDTQININCSGSIRPVITQTIMTSLTDPMWVCSNGQSIMLQGSIAPGTLVIDCEKRSITHTADAEIMKKLTLDSLFFELEPNSDVDAPPHVITCSNGAAGEMTGKYRWL